MLASRSTEESEAEGGKYEVPKDTSRDGPDCLAQHQDRMVWILDIRRRVARQVCG